MQPDLGLDLCASGAGCYSTMTAGIVVSLGHTPGSRKSGCLSNNPQALHMVLADFGKLATLPLLSGTIGSAHRT